MLNAGRCVCTSQGTANGEGTYHFTDGSKYVGQVRDGRITGTGRYITSEGDVSDQNNTDNSGLWVAPALLRVCGVYYECLDGRWCPCAVTGVRGDFS